ncbi:hypothetical protein NW768_011903 [Fusarium equiseti]|uniref:Uncharacterized protein n=1 Tax=Fusarium equiseti TaxID=61235 RepID=A0ABQ8QW63_FUSEQ|nr:hypothetical protein NW768_011903 [Fusarium equiseti]
MSNTREAGSWWSQMFNNTGYQELPTTTVKDKAETTSQYTPRRCLRLSTRGIFLVLAAILLVPTFLALAALEGRQYLSDGTGDVFEVTGGQVAVPKATPGVVPDLVKGSSPAADIPDIPGDPLDIPDSLDVLDEPEVPVDPEAPAIPTSPEDPDAATVLDPETAPDAVDGLDAPEAPVVPSIPVMAKPPKMPQQVSNRRLIILLPANAPGVNLCKAMVTAIALGYPTPIILNWGKSGSHLAKIAGVLDYLDWSVRLKSNHKDHLNPEDLIMVADSSDSWFQLPPSVLIQRYHDLNAEANERLQKQWTGSGPCPMKQTIMVSAQKRCWPSPQSGSELHCTELPESPLREDLYGPDTDADPEMRMVDVRPRYINSGAFIGPVGDMRRYFRRAQDRYTAKKAIQGNHFYSDQGFFGEIWGEQEIWRTWRRELGDNIDINLNASVMVRDQFEYHVGLDYYQTISIPTVFEEDDGDIVSLNNQTMIAARSAELEIEPVRLTQVPPEIANATNPIGRVVSAEQRRSLDWGDMNVYADFFTTAIPVNIHHNAHINNLKGRRIWWWPRMWFFPYLRDLVTAQLKQRRQQPLHRIQTPEDGKIVYWGLEKYKEIRRFMDLRRELVTSDFDGICMSKWAKKEKQNWWDVVFMDDRGAWEL